MVHTSMIFLLGDCYFKTSSPKNYTASDALAFLLPTGELTAVKILMDVEILVSCIALSLSLPVPWFGGFGIYRTYWHFSSSNMLCKIQNLSAISDNILDRQPV